MAMTEFSFPRQLSQNRLGSPFIVRMLYDDRITYNIIDAASETLGK